MPLGGTLIRPVPTWIPWHHVADWSDRHGYDWTTRDFLDRCIQAMDNEYLAWWRETNATKQD